MADKTHDHADHSDHGHGHDDGHGHGHGAPAGDVIPEGSPQDMFLTAMAMAALAGLATMMFLFFQGVTMPEHAEHHAGEGAHVEHSELAKPGEAGSVESEEHAAH